MSATDAQILGELEDVLRQRRDAAPAGSYSAQLVSDPEAVQRKIMEEAFELCLELGRGEQIEPQRAASEAADVVFHVLAGLVGAGVSFEAVLAELADRRGRPASAEAGQSS
jgi:phosphoribosyl-ATP pyrophosphohydrolase